MSKEAQRIWLDQVDNSSIVEPNTTEDIICPVRYSRFKYGDGEVAGIYGTMLAEKALEDGIIGKGTYAVTSSGYKIAPPASHSMLAPFVDRVRQASPETIIKPFKINRGVLTQGDYASMDITERQKIMEKNGLSMPEGFDSSVDGVIALDDILVTGSHERMLHKLFIRSGLSETPISYAYILKVEDGCADPRVEAEINHCAIRSLSHVAQLSRETSLFVPNARICKMVVSSDQATIEEFCNNVNDAALETILRYIEGDELHEMDTYRSGVEAFRNAYANRKAMALTR